MNIIEKKFQTWTKDLPDRKKYITVFEQIRDIPFAVESKLFFGTNASEQMLKRNKGFCVPKHHLLGLMFLRLKVPVLYHTYSFRWSDLTVAMPAKLKKLAKEVPLTYHLACKALIKEKWVFLDATWDAPLKKTGFFVNENWDGETDTKNAVTPVEEFVSETISRQKALYENKLKTYTFSEKLKLTRFSKELNKWLNGIR